MKKQLISFFQSNKASWLIPVFSLLFLASLIAQVEVQRYTDSDAQHYYDVEVPSGHEYVYLLARGADGGSMNSTDIWGGGGAQVSGYIAIGSRVGQIPVGSTLRLIPGQAGSNGDYFGGGGGGTAIAFKGPDANADWVLLMVAGGGGGSGGRAGSTRRPGKGGTDHTYGLAGEDGDGSSQENEGTNGGGGEHKGSQAYPGGGAFGDGAGGCPGRAGYQNNEPMGGAGGAGCDDGMAAGGFGFGGGGAGMPASDRDKAGGGGGGGGYSGGGGGYSGTKTEVFETGNDPGGGGGGGSYANPDYLRGWTMQPFNVSPSNDGYVLYEFRNSSVTVSVSNPDKCLDAWGTEDGANILLNNCTGSNYQHWLLNGSALHLSKMPARCLDLIHSNTGNGTNIQLWDCNGTNAQKWIYDVTHQVIRSRIDFDKCLVVNNSNFTAGTNIQLWDCNDTDAQKWQVDGVRSAMPDATARNQRIRLEMAPDKCLDVNNSNFNDGTNIQLLNCNGTDAQYFTFDGQQIKTQKDTTKCVDLEYAHTDNGTNIRLWTCNGNEAQEWIYDGFAKAFRSAVDPNKCLDLDHSKVANGTNIQLWDCNDSAAQRFEIDDE